MSGWSRMLGASIALLGGLATVPQSALAATLTVNTTSDEVTPGDGTCSLREAIAAVDSAGMSGDCGAAAFGANTIALGAQRYTLSIAPAGPDDNATGDLNVLATVSGLTIAGAGAGATTIDASGLGDRVLEVDAGADVTVSDLTITGGHAPDGSTGSRGADATNGTPAGNGGQGGIGQNGGGIQNAGTLSLSEIAVTDNSAGSAGAGGAGGTGQMNNRVGGTGGSGGPAGGGGGIYNESTGTLALAAATLSGNRAGAGGDGGDGGDGYSADGVTGGQGGSASTGGAGGGIYNNGGALTITDSTIDDNFAGTGGTGGTGGRGGEIDGHGGDGGTGGNAGSGGGVAGAGGSLTVTNSTLASNHGGDGGAGGTGGSMFTSGSPPLGGGGGTGGTGGGGGDGGGLIMGGTASLANATFAGNQVGALGAGGAGGVVPSPAVNGNAGGTFPAQPTGGGLFVSGSVSLQNTIVALSTGGNCDGATITDGGHDLSYPDSTCPGKNEDPKLGSLNDYGGPTHTIALLPGSAAIDQIPAGAGCPATDQRGVPRPQPAGGQCDIGAYELALPTCQPVTAGTGAGQPVAVQLSCRDPGGVAVSYALDANPGHGTLTGLDPASGKVTYTPAAGYSGADGFTYHATSANGTAGAQTVTITVNATAGGAPGGGAPGGGTPSGGTPGGGTPPTITNARLTNTRFRVGSSLTAISARKAPLGTAFRLTLSAPARLQITITRTVAGRRAGRRCVASSRKLRRAHAKPCVRTLTIGVLSRANEPQGQDQIAFSGRIGRHALGAGAYHAALTAGNRFGTSRPVSLAFTVV